VGSKDQIHEQGITTLLHIMSLLRDRTHGCPWDLKQSFTSLTRYTLEEVYEVVEAIESNAIEKLRDELGDLLFQIVFYAQLASEEGYFNFADVVAGISDKLLRRHPHVFPAAKLENFGQTQHLSAEDVVGNWEAIKSKERSEEQRDGDSITGLMANVPIASPALDRALKIQGRAAQVGFDWPDKHPVLAKLKEELAELEIAFNKDDAEQLLEELGDVLFAVVNLARHTKMDPETALRLANRKFTARFAFIEEQLRNTGKQFGDVDLEQLDHYWEQAKLQGL
jgi:nucleoside triphosphate diphosphatase